MSLDVWFQQDIRNTLLALRSVQRAHIAHADMVEAHIQRERDAYDAYRDGFDAALQSVAVAVGIPLDVRAQHQAHAPSRRRLAQPDERNAARIVGQHATASCDAFGE